jgi:hypothetical protein
MKKIVPAVILFLGFIPAVFSQDKIITINNDTIDCKINKVSRNTIYFDLNTLGVKSSGEMALNMVSGYIVANKTSPEVQKKTDSGSGNRFRFGLSGGAGYLLGSTQNAEDQMVFQGFTFDQAESYYNDMKLGVSAIADLYLLIPVNYGVGIKYKLFFNSASTEGFIDPQDGVHLYYTTYSEKIYVNFAGASFYYQETFGNQKSLVLSSTLSLGLTTYRDEAEYLHGYYLLTGKNAGFDLGIGLEYFLTSRISLGADLSAFYSSIRKVKITDGTSTSTIELDKDNYENLSRIDLSAGIRIYF